MSQISFNQKNANKRNSLQMSIIMSKKGQAKNINLDVPFRKSSHMDFYGKLLFHSAPFYIFMLVNLYLCVFGQKVSM